MRSFLLSVVSPDGDLFSGECVKFDVRGTEGALAVMAGHVPFVTFVKEGPCTLQLPDGTVREGETLGGLLSVERDRVIFFSGTFKLKDMQ